MRMPWTAAIAGKGLEPVRPGFAPVPTLKPPGGKMEDLDEIPAWQIILGVLLIMMLLAWDATVLAVIYPAAILARYIPGGHNV